MDKWQAIQNFWSKFGIPAYDETAVPGDAQMPYITYDAAVSTFDNPIQLSASIWYRSTSWRDISQKVNEISMTLGSDLYVMPMGDHQYMTLLKSNTFAQRMRDDDSSVRRIYIMLQAEFLTFE